MDIKKILWPTDFSSSAEAALPYVTSLTRNYNAEVHILYVLDDIAHHEAWYGAFDEAHVNKLMERSKEQVREKLDKICDTFLEGCPMYFKHVAVGDPAKEILKLLESEEMDMVVMAKQGKEGNFGFGSVTDKVVKHSAVPVTIIPIDRAASR